MEKNDVFTIPLIVYEAMLDKEDRQQKRLIFIIALLIVLLVASNCFWLYEYSQYEYEVEKIEVDGKDGGNANYIGNNGDIFNGEDHGNEDD